MCGYQKGWILIGIKGLVVVARVSWIDAEPWTAYNLEPFWGWIGGKGEKLIIIPVSWRVVKWSDFIALFEEELTGFRVVGLYGLFYQFTIISGVKKSKLK